MLLTLEEEEGAAEEVEGEEEEAGGKSDHRRNLFYPRFLRTHYNIGMHLKSLPL